MTSLPTREVLCLTLEALNEACGLLNETLERGEHQFGHLCRLVELLESDLLIVDHAGEKEPEAVLLPTLELLRRRNSTTNQCPS